MNEEAKSVQAALAVADGSGGGGTLTGGGACFEQPARVTRPAATRATAAALPASQDEGRFSTPRGRPFLGVMSTSLMVFIRIRVIRQDTDTTRLPVRWK